MDSLIIAEGRTRNQSNSPAPGLANGKFAERLAAFEAAKQARAPV
jgi:hypothetical protein